MGNNFGSLVFTPMVRALQEKYGSRRQYARMEGSGAPGHLTNPRLLPSKRASTWRRSGPPDGRMFSTEAVPKDF
jgi:hypothetical protein